MRCSACGARSDPDRSFCQRCGSAVFWTMPPQQPHPPGHARLTAGASTTSAPQARAAPSTGIPGMCKRREPCGQAVRQAARRTVRTRRRRRGRRMPVRAIRFLRDCLPMRTVSAASRVRRAEGFGRVNRSTSPLRPTRFDRWWACPPRSQPRSPPPRSAYRLLARPRARASDHRTGALNCRCTNRGRSVSLRRPWLLAFRRVTRLKPCARAYKAPSSCAASSNRMEACRRRQSRGRSTAGSDWTMKRSGPSGSGAGQPA